MKTLFISLSILFSSSLFGQTTNVVTSDTLKKVNQNPNIVRGIDISKASENEQYLIRYMETLSDEEALKFAKSFILGDIMYKKD